MLRVKSSTQVNVNLFLTIGEVGKKEDPYTDLDYGHEYYPLRVGSIADEGT